jgi:hypothetical protein
MNNSVAAAVVAEAVIIAATMAVIHVRSLAYQPLIGTPIRPMDRQDTNLHLSKGSYGMLGLFGPHAVWKDNH